jgi:hypothetical protein
LIGNSQNDTRRNNLGYHEKLTIISSLQKELRSKGNLISQLNNRIDQQEITINRLMNKRKIVGFFLTVRKSQILGKK